jgi:putative metallohydrolase (TIGR04338 family)
MPSTRDSQRQRLYDAEEQVCRQLEYAAAGARLVEVAGSTLTLPLEVRFGSLDAAQAYVEHARRSAAFAGLFPRAARVPLRVRRRRGPRAAHYDAPATIALHDDPASLRELVALHEVTHHGQFHDHLPGASHGPAFAGALVHLVTELIGPEVGLLLTTALAEHRVATSTGVAA